MFKVMFLLCLLLRPHVGVMAASGDLSQTFTLEGELYDTPTGTDPFLGQAEIEVQILSPDKQCVLYAEKQTVDTTFSEGIFNIQIGSNIGDIKRVATVDPGNNMALVYQNTSVIQATGTLCPGVTSFTPSVSGGEGRYIQISVTPTASGITDVLSPDIYLGSVPSAIVAQTLQGLSPSSFLKLATVPSLTQVNLEDVFSNTNYPILQDLLTSGGTSTNSTINAVVNADTDANGTGSVQFQINGSTKAEVKNDGDFAVGTNSFYVDSTTQKVGLGSSVPSFDLSFGGNVSKTVGIERNPSAGSAGSNMTLNSGGATVGATNLVGGDLILSSGISTGTGTSNIHLQTASAGASGTADNAPTTKMTILGNGNVGIGTSTPTAKLEVNGNISSPDSGYQSERFGRAASAPGDFATALGFNAQAVSWSTALGYSAQANVTGSVAIGYNAYIPATAGGSNIAIGADSAATAWDTIAIGKSAKATQVSAIAIGYGAVADVMRTLVIGSGSDPITDAYLGRGRVHATPWDINLNATGGTGTDITGAKMLISGGRGTGAGPGGAIQFQTAPASSTGSTLNALQARMTIDANGNVGIGTNTPEAKLDIAPGSIRFQNNYPWNYLEIDTSSSVNNYVMNFINSGLAQPSTLLMRYHNNGRGIKFTFPDTLIAPLISSSGAYNLALGTNNTEQVTVNTLGNVGIGTTGPTAKLEVYVAGTAGTVISKFVNDAATCSITDAGLSCASDERLKTDIKPIPNALEKLLSLDGVTFRWKKGDSGERQMGFIAQKVEKIAPELVRNDKDLGYKQVNYSNFVALLTQALKELYGKVLILYENDSAHDKRFEFYSKEIAVIKEQMKSSARNPASTQDRNKEFSTELSKLKSENAIMKSYICNKDPSAPFCKK